LLPAKAEAVLQGVIDRLIEIRKCYGVEMNMEETSMMRISRQPSPTQITINKKNSRKM
jgi:hypothetical protein